MTMTDYHRSLKLPADRQKLIEKATAADDGCISVGGFAARLGQLRTPDTSHPSAVGASDSVPPASGVVAIGRLIQLARREEHLRPEQFAVKIGIDLAELQAAETGSSVPEPRVLYALSEALDISYQKLMSLAGHRKDRDEILEREVLRFAASSAPMDKLSHNEVQALQDLLRLLQD